jgi:uncharacterized cupredoxin-like copper-binding protein
MMKAARSCLISVIFAAATPVHASTVVNVALWDKSEQTSASAKDSNLGMGMHGDMTSAGFGIKLDHTSIPSGKVTFQVTNRSNNSLHEMIVAPVRSKDQILTYVKDENRVDEEATADLGEVSELDPGKSGTLTLNLKPGKYVVYCNVPGHYMGGMWALLTVRP